MEARTVIVGSTGMSGTRYIWLPAAVIALLAAHCVLAYTATLGTCTTFDEPLHMVAGVSYWLRDDYRLQPENGNLPQRWCAIPLLAMLPANTLLDAGAWARSDAPKLGELLLYSSDVDPSSLLAAARAMAVCWSLATCVVIFVWSRAVNDSGGAIVSLLLAVFWPALVAHGPLATSDVCLTFFFTASCLALWLSLQRVSISTVATSSAAIGLAAIAKHSAVLLAPVAIALLLVATAARRPVIVSVFGREWEPRAAATTLAVRLAVLVPPLVAAMLCIWAACGFRYAACAPSDESGEFYFFQSLSSCAERAGFVGQAAMGASHYRLLPEAWLQGLCTVVAKGSARNAFALGQYSLHGWWWYFPLCIVVKNTIPGIILALCGLWVAIGSVAQRSIVHGTRNTCMVHRLAPLTVILVLTPILLLSRLNIGERHCLPLYPPLIVLAGATWPLISRPLPLRLVIGALVLWHGMSTVARWPSTLAYFNEVVPRGREYKWLVDSNLDWGQDLPRLVRWLEEHREPNEPLHVNIFTAAPVRYFLPDGEVLGEPPDPAIPQRLVPGLYCVSATALAAVYDEPLGFWCQKFEATFQKARQFLADTDAPHDDDVHAAAVRAFNILQAGRLRAFLRHRPPDADVGGSILVFRLSATDLDRALVASPSELAETSWMERDSGGSSEALIRRGTELMGTGNLIEAEKAFEQARRLDPYNGTAWAQLGLVYAARLRYEQAIAAYQKATRLMPDDAESLLNLGILLADLGRDDEAITAYDECLNRDGKLAKAYLHRGFIRLRRGAASQAREDFNRFVELGGELPLPLRPLIEAQPTGAPP